MSNERPNTIASISKLLKDVSKIKLKHYLKNEDNNYHTENILLLAEQFGTDEQIEYAKARVEAINFEPNVNNHEEYRKAYDAKNFPERNVEIEREINDFYYQLVKIAEG